MKNNTALAATFDDFVSSLHDDQTVPPVSVVSEITDGHFKRTGMVPVLMEDESTECPVFADWGTHYEFEAWKAYRQMTDAQGVFQAMAKDVLDKVQWGPEAIDFITIVSGLINVQAAYSDKFGHEPVNKNKFIKSYAKHGPETVLRADVY